MMFKPLMRPIPLFLLTALLIVGCGEEPQCLEDSDCLAEGVCTEATCEAGICKTATTPDCCGNGICESAVENRCTCAVDCGACEGPISLILPDQAPLVTRYIKRQCSDEDACVVTFDEAEQIESDEFHETSVDGVLLNALVNYLNPSEVLADQVILELHLIEITDPRIILPITITSVQLLDGDVLYGRNVNPHRLQRLDQRLEIRVPLVRMTRLPEEDHSLQLRVAFEYAYLTEKQQINDGVLVYDLFGRPVMSVVRDIIKRSIMNTDLGQAVTLINLQSPMLPPPELAPAPVPAAAPAGSDPTPAVPPAGLAPPAGSVPGSVPAPAAPLEPAPGSAPVPAPATVPLPIPAAPTAVPTAAPATAPEQRLGREA
jgi:hypothetical protein